MRTQPDQRKARLSGGRPPDQIRAFEPGITAASPLEVSGDCVCTWVPGWPGYALKFRNRACPIRHRH